MDFNIVGDVELALFVCERAWTNIYYEFAFVLNPVNLDTDDNIRYLMSRTTFLIKQRYKLLDKIKVSFFIHVADDN